MWEKSSSRSALKQLIFDLILMDKHHLKAESISNKPQTEIYRDFKNRTSFSVTIDLELHQQIQIRGIETEI